MSNYIHYNITSPSESLLEEKFSFDIDIDKSSVQSVFIKEGASSDSQVQDDFEKFIGSDVFKRRFEDYIEKLVDQKVEEKLSSMKSSCVNCKERVESSSSDKSWLVFEEKLELKVENQKIS